MALGLFAGTVLVAQSVPETTQTAKFVSVDGNAAGDAPDDPGPLATGLSADLKPEVSGSAFFTFAIAYGINEKILDRKTYLPVVEKSWKGMLGHIYADGRLGSIQPIDGQPGKFKPSASYVYGVGGS